MLYLILPNIRSCYNVGSIFRTADAFGVNKIFLCGYTPTPDKNPKIKKVSLGAEKNVPWEHHALPTRLIARLKKEGWNVIGVEQSPRSIDHLKFRVKKPTVFIFGNEVKGVSKSILKVCNAVVEIPMRGYKESLNVSVAAGIVLARMLNK